MISSVHAMFVGKLLAIGLLNNSSVLEKDCLQPSNKNIYVIAKMAKCPNQKATPITTTHVHNDS